MRRHRCTRYYPIMRSYTPLWSSKWEKKFAEENARARQDYQEGLAAGEALESLERRFAALAAIVSSDAAQTEGVKTLLEGVRDDIAKQKLSQSNLMAWLPTHCLTPRTSALADKVFGMPELAEYILTFVSVPDLLRLYRVNKTFYNTIEGSGLLQRRLGLRADPTAHLALPSEHLVYHSEGVDMNEMFYSSGHLSDDAHTIPDQNRMPVKINVCTYSCHSKGGDEIKLRKLGERCQKMLITQPPIKEMGVYMQCCMPRYRPYRDRQTEPPLEVVKCETGITTAQIWEVVQRTQKEHRLCPNADSFDHNSEGFVHLRMTLEGSLTLSDDDPALIAKNKRRKESREEDVEFQSRETRFRPYIRAKQSGEYITCLASVLCQC